MSITTLSNLLIIVGILWIIGGYFSYMQTMKTNQILHELSPLAERLYQGKNAGFMRTRRIIFAAVSDDGNVAQARVLHTAFFLKPAKVSPFDELRGKNLFELNPSSMNLEPVMERALKSLIEDAKIKKKRA